MIDNKIDDIDKKISTLLEYITPSRHKKFMEILQYRTRYISIMLENIYQPHNASAVLRSCDAYGIQDLHIIEQNNVFRPDQEIAMGSAKWVDVYSDYQDISQAYNCLRNRGYRIIATSLKKDASPLVDIDVSTPSVLVFGNELNGLTQEAKDLADANLYIPMFGFVESFNVSVSVAITLSHIITKLHNSNIKWKLQEKEINTTLLQWLRLDIHKSNEIEARINPPNN